MGGLVSILGGIQPWGRLLTTVSAVLGQGRGADGLLQRFQLIVWRMTPAPGAMLTGCRRKTPATVPLVCLITSIIGAGSSVHNRMTPGEIPYLHFNSVAQGLFDEWRADLERRIRDDLPEAFESHLAKYRKLCPALALLIHLAEGNNGSVTDTAMIKAAAWCEYLETHAARVYALPCSRTLPPRMPWPPKSKRAYCQTHSKPKTSTVTTGATG